MDSKQLIENIPVDDVTMLRKQIYGLLGENVGKYKRDDALPLLDQFKQLEEHHIKETEFLIALLINWGKTSRDLRKRLEELEEIEWKYNKLCL